MDFLGKHPVRPFRFLKREMLPSATLKKQFSVEWKPILSKMTQDPSLSIPMDDSKITATFMNSSYQAATDYLKNNVCGYIWRLEKQHLNWSVATWSRWTQPGYVRK